MAPWKGMRLIMRYSNRKYYDTGEHRHVSLRQIAALVCAGDEVRVLDRTSGRDLTVATMARISLALKKQALAAPPDILQDIIRTGRLTQH